MKCFVTSVCILLLSSPQIFAQCLGTESEVSLDVITDAYGYEGYWEITAGAGQCGVNTIASGGNLNVGCIVVPEGQTPGGYGNNSTFEEGPWCFETGAQYTLHYRDDYGDGGFSFRIRINGIILQEIEGSGAGDDYTFTVQDPPAFDVALTGVVNSTRVMGYYQPRNEIPLTVQFANFGSEEINALEWNYRVDGGETVTVSETGLSIPNFTQTRYTLPMTWNTQDYGVHTLDIWVSKINGQDDEVTNNDMLSQQIEVGPPKMNLISSYNGSNNAFTVIANSSDEIDRPTDLDYHSTWSLNQLWVVNKETANTGGTTIVIDNAGLENQESEFFQDGNAWHFMSLPTAIAFGENGNFGTAPGVFDANHQGTANAFTGPTLWSGDLSIFAQPSGGNGSHLDMLHESPYSQGMAWERDNVYWIFDGYNNDIVRYDFAEDHNPGNAFHGDAIIRRYSDESVAKDPDGVVPSHLILDEEKKWLYAVDNGNRRVIRIDITTGTTSPQPPSYGPHEEVVEYSVITNYQWEVVVDGGLTKPAGIDIMGDQLLVSDYATGNIHVYNISSMPAQLEFIIETPAEGIMGIVIAPDGRITYVDHETSEIVKITPAALGISADENANLTLYPNPSSNGFMLMGLKNALVNIDMIDISGRTVAKYTNLVAGTRVFEGFPAGIYMARILNTETNKVSVIRYIQN